MLSTCTECSPGTYSNNGQSSCATCQAGEYSSSAASACSICRSSCDEGYQLQGVCNPNDRSCSICPAGSHKAVSLLRSSTLCNAQIDFQVQGNNEYACSACPAGSASSDGAASCTLCPPGTYAEFEGSSVCSPCSPGEISSSGSTSCTPCISSCPSGRYLAGSCGGSSNK